MYEAGREPEENRVVTVTGEAWRWLARVRPGPDGWPERLPLEPFTLPPGMAGP